MINKKNKQRSWRQFLRGAIATAGSTIALPSITTSNTLRGRGGVPVSERIIAAGIGIGGQGGNDLTWMMQKDWQRASSLDALTRY